MKDCKLRGAQKEKALQLLEVDDRICDKQFGYDIDGSEVMRARREIAELLSEHPGSN